MKPNIAEIRELNEFCETWFNDVREGEPIAQDEIDTVKELIVSNKNLIGGVERQAEEIDRLRIALKKVKPYIEEDFPNGPDGESDATVGWRLAYKAILEALKEGE